MQQKQSFLIFYAFALLGSAKCTTNSKTNIKEF